MVVQIKPSSPGFHSLGPKQCYKVPITTGHQQHPINTTPVSSFFSLALPIPLIHRQSRRWMLSSSAVISIASQAMESSPYSCQCI